MYLGEDMEGGHSSHFLKTALAVPTAFITWVFVSGLAHLGLYIVDFVGSFEGEILQKLLREWVAPGVGAYVALYVVDEYIEKANIKWVAIWLCLPVVFLFLGLSFYVIIFEQSNYDFSWQEQILHWGIAISTCIGAYNGYKKMH